MTQKISFHDLSTMTRAQRDRLLQRTEADLSSYEEKVIPIIEAVRAEGEGGAGLHGGLHPQVP